ncbi:Derlin [Venustampulla echinocandica]|uniref:Derlin n=1 Tax=Venustampulla echinocandica TaxID=2656787 RepID=A0A370TIN4_9HELO|nr:Derlin [Venustampulla echinocandica]RDL35215.1 Derlin [Venustampulla echinocandica]
MSAVEYFKQAPPIIRTIAASAFTLSILVYTGVVPGYYVVFYPQTLLWLPPQLWRLVTSFLITGPQLSILFDTYFLYTYGAKLERSSPKFTKPGEFFTYIVFVMLTIVGLNHFITGTTVFTSGLIMAFIYTSSQDDRGTMATLYIITIPAQWLPLAMILITFLMSGKTAALVSLTGLIAAHLHDFLTRLWPTFGGGRNLLPTPGFVRRMFETKTASVTHKSYGTAFAQPQGQGSSSGPLPESWKSRGSGHRLGGT